MDNRKRKTELNKGVSLTVRTINIIILGCTILGLVALLIGLSVYGTNLVQQYARHAFETASHASSLIKQDMDCEPFSRQIMEIYRNLTPQQREKMGTEEYRSYFSEIDTTVDGGGTWDTLVHLLNNFVIDVNDTYLAMYDKDTCSLVYFADPDEEDRFYPGEWEPVSESEVSKFLNWNGEGMLYDISRTEKYGWMCTTGYPFKDDKGEIYAFALTDVTISNLDEAIKDYVIKVTLSILALTVLMCSFLTRRVRNIIVKPIDQIAEATKAYIDDKKKGIENTNRFASLNIASSDELRNLSKVMADMEQNLIEYEQRITRISEEKQRITSELDMASRIQNSMLPHTFPPFPDRKEFDIFALMNPAREIGGDFYDFFLIDDDHLGIVMADVSGKGIPAALFMMASKIIVQSCAMLGKSAAETLIKTNEAICSNNQVEMFVTVWFGILEISTGKLKASNAGHEYPALMKNGVFSLLKDKHGFVIGGIEDSVYSEYEIQLEPGDKLFLYTDGVPEASDADHQLFGNERMLDALNKDPSASVEGILQNVQIAVNDFVKDAEQFDDLTMLCLEYKGNKKDSSKIKKRKE